MGVAGTEKTLQKQVASRLKMAGSLKLCFLPVTRSAANTGVLGPPALPRGSGPRRAIPKSLVITLLAVMSIMSLVADLGIPRLL